MSETPMLAGFRTVMAPVSTIANRSEAKVKGATASGDRSNRRRLTECNA